MLSSVGLEEGELILDQVEAETEAGATVAADASDRVRSELVASRQQLLQEASVSSRGVGEVIWLNSQNSL